MYRISNLCCILENQTNKLKEKETRLVITRVGGEGKEEGDGKLDEGGQRVQPPAISKY